MNDTEKKTETLELEIGLLKTELEEWTKLFPNKTPQEAKDELDKYVAKDLEQQSKPNSEEEKLWEELGIKEESNENISKRKVFREVKRLGDLFAVQNSKKINVSFVTEKTPQDKSDSEESVVESKDDEFDICLQLDRKDKLGSFCPVLVFWTLAQELTALKFNNCDFDNCDKDPLFWKHFEEGLVWTKNNIDEDYREELELLLVPSTFPHERLEIESLYQIYFPNSEDKGENEQVVADKKIVDRAWRIIRQTLIELVDQELKKNPSDEELIGLGIKLMISYNLNDNQYLIRVNYHPRSLLEKQLVKLLIDTSLKLEIEELQKQKEQLPTSENFDKMVERNRILDEYLQDLDEEKYKKIKEEINKIK